MTTTRSLALLLPLLFLARIATAQSQCNPQTLQIPSTVSSTITISSCKNSNEYYDVWYLKNLTAGRKLRLTVTKQTLPNINITVQRVQNLQIVVVVTKTEFSANTATLDFEVPVTQDTYSVFVRSTSTFATGSYTLSVSDLESPNLATQIIPIVGHLAGGGGSEFRSDLKLHNTTSSVMTGRMIFTPRGQSRSSSDVAVSFSIPARGVAFYEDVYTTGFPGGSGAARVAIVPDNTTPGALIVDTSTYTATPGGGELGQNPTVFPESSFSGTGTELVGILGKSVERTNIFVMTGPNDTTIRFQVRDTSGTVARVATRTFPRDSTTQLTAADLMGAVPPPNASLEAQIQSGSARVALSPVNNVTNQGRWVDFKSMP